MSQRQFEITYFLQGSNAATQRAIVTATDATMARKIFEQQNPQCKVSGSPREVK